MPITLAHRGNGDGASIRENRVGAFRAALERGWGVEVDIRRSSDGRFYLSHDPLPVTSVTDDRRAESLFADIRRHRGAVVAINIKECGYEEALVDFLTEHRVLEQGFLFDMELVEQTPGRTASLFRSLCPGIQIAARVSDRDEPIERALAVAEANVIWLDEFEGPWATAGDVGRLRASGRSVYAVSPELHGFSLEVARARWVDFFDWGVDGICTDYPAALDAFRAAADREAVA